MNTDVERTRVIDALEVALASAQALNDDALEYLIGMALDEAKERHQKSRPKPSEKSK